MSNSTGGWKPSFFNEMCYSYCTMRRSTAALLAFSLLLSACVSGAPPTVDTSEDTVFEETSSLRSSVESAPIDPQSVLKIPVDIAKDFSLEEAKNIEDILKAYGITLSPKEKEMLSQEKFVLKRLPETTIHPQLTDQRGREFLGLYNTVSGIDDLLDRLPSNTLFWSADIFLHSYTLLATELLKEMENTAFAPSMLMLSKNMYTAAAASVKNAPSDTEKAKWMKVRNYFAMPYALLSTSIEPLTEKSYVDERGMTRDPEQVLKEFRVKDTAADTEATAKAFIKNLGVDAESEKALLTDLHAIFEPNGPMIPAVFQKEYEDHISETGIKFMVDFTQFTPRSHYTSSSLRRQYFRAMNWYIQLPFFVQSDELTSYAFAVSQLLADHKEDLQKYSLLESTINFLVGASDDLMPVDYLQALEVTKGKPDPSAAIRSHLLTVKQPKIKSLAAAYPSVGDVQSADVLAATTGMRFFSGKFIMDSYWTGYLTQGDEAKRPGYPAKLPHMASSLEVMTLLGSDYAHRMIPTLDFTTSENLQAIEKAIGELRTEVESMEEADWRMNAYTTALWTIKGLFSFVAANRAMLPRFMQGEAYAAKNLMTGAGFWSEMRHTVLLYAKQSFAEKGGGPGCNQRTAPPPPKGYIEPQPLAYRRLRALAQTSLDGLQGLGFTLHNFDPLTAYIGLMDEVIAITDKELSGAMLSENLVKHEDPNPDDPKGTCIWYEVKVSDWEFLRKGLVEKLDMALPYPVEGPVLPVKDMRAAIVADVHTGGDSAHDTEILYEGTGVPHVILVAVKDANGPRLAIGFTYAQYETRQEYGGKRMTDEQWQEHFYKGTDPNDAFSYTEVSSWPKLNSWYAPLFPSH